MLQCASLSFVPDFSCNFSFALDMPFSAAANDLLQRLGISRDSETLLFEACLCFASTGVLQ